jgi:xylan 1,4-beta-xylosidase
MGSPKQLTRQQVERLKRVSSGVPASTELVKVKGNAPLVREVEIRENDVVLLNLVRQ